MAMRRRRSTESGVTEIVDAQACHAGGVDRPLEEARAPAGQAHGPAVGSSEDEVVARPLSEMFG